jgi:hypothetical protein
VIGTFFVVGLIFIPIGIAILSASSKVVEVPVYRLANRSGVPSRLAASRRRSTTLNPQNAKSRPHGIKLASSGTASRALSVGCTALPRVASPQIYPVAVKSREFCRITFNIDADMVAPIYVYYKLDNYYQRGVACLACV